MGVRVPPPAHQQSPGLCASGVRTSGAAFGLLSPAGPDPIAATEPVVQWPGETRAVAQFGSAPALGAGGRRFNSDQPDGRPGFVCAKLWRHVMTQPAYGKQFSRSRRTGRMGEERPALPNTLCCQVRCGGRQHDVDRGCSSMVELQPSKLAMRVRFPSPALCLLASAMLRSRRGCLLALLIGVGHASQPTRICGGGRGVMLRGGRGFGVIVGLCARPKRFTLVADRKWPRRKRPETQSPRSSVDRAGAF